MRKNTVRFLVVTLAILLVAPSVMAQESPADVVQGYYAALAEAAGTGDVTAMLDLFADDATVTIVGLSPQPVQGKEAMQAAFAGMFSMLKGVEVTVGDVAVDGDTVTVTYTMAVEGMGEIPATDTFVIQDGKIQSLSIEIAPEALAGAAAAVPEQLPTTGGPVSGLLPGLLVLGGAAFVALSRRFSR
jgi:uncharacterized protein (TIGR02246 family)